MVSDRIEEYRGINGLLKNRLAKENLTYRISKTEFNFASYLAAHPEKLSQAWKRLAICADAGGEQQAFREEAQKA